MKEIPFLENTKSNHRSYRLRLVDEYRVSQSKPKPNILKSQRTLSLENLRAIR